MLSSRSAPAGSGFFWFPRPRSLRLVDLLVEILAGRAELTCTKGRPPFNWNLWNTTYAEDR
jgi:hypothetical protein